MRLADQSWLRFWPKLVLVKLGLGKVGVGQTSCWPKLVTPDLLWSQPTLTASIRPTLASEKVFVQVLVGISPLRTPKKVSFRNKKTKSNNCCPFFSFLFWVLRCPLISHAFHSGPPLRGTAPRRERHSSGPPSAGPPSVEPSLQWTAQISFFLLSLGSSRGIVGPPGLADHTSTRRPPEREEGTKFAAGERKAKSEILDGPAEGRSRGGTDRNETHWKYGRGGRGDDKGVKTKNGSKFCLILHLFFVTILLGIQQGWLSPTKTKLNLKGRGKLMRTACKLTKLITHLNVTPMLFSKHIFTVFRSFRLIFAVFAFSFVFWSFFDVLSAVKMEQILANKIDLSNCIDQK